MLKLGQLMEYCKNLQEKYAENKHQKLVRNHYLTQETLFEKIYFQRE